nr:hypothetical protein [Tanacetum cinerariifolium]
RGVTIVVSKPGYETVGSKDLTCEDWMVNTRTDADLSAAIQNALQTLLPQIRAEIRKEFRTSFGPSDAGRNPLPVTIHMWLERFNKQKPHSFEKATAPVDAENWISHMEKIFDVMGCEDGFKERLAVYKFKGNALAWWKAYKQAKGGDAWLVTERLKREYHSIRQTSTETSTEFMQRFLRLAGFLGAAAGIEEEQAKNFQWGLHRDDEDTERPDKRQPELFKSFKTLCLLKYALMKRHDYVITVFFTKWVVTFMIRTEIREEFRTSSGPSDSGGNPPLRFTRSSVQVLDRRMLVEIPHRLLFILGLNALTDVMGCEDAFKTRLAVYKFEGNALAWWKAYKQAKGGDAWLITAAAGTEEEQAKNFQWGLRRSTLNHLMCMSYTDVAQVANAARNYEILHERDDDDTERPDKRQRSGDRHQPTSQQSSHRSHGHNNDRHGSDRRGGSDSHRSSNNNYSGSNNRLNFKSIQSSSSHEHDPNITA